MPCKNLNGARKLVKNEGSVNDGLFFHFSIPPSPGKAQLTIFVLNPGVRGEFHQIFEIRLLLHNKLFLNLTINVFSSWLF